MLNSYPSIFNLGHRAVQDLLSVLAIVEEKIDGSQFSFGVDEAGVLHCRSKGASIDPDAPEKMFAAGVATVKALVPMLEPGWTYRGEYLQKPKHNALAYSRVPRGHIILFDINTGLETYLPPANKFFEAERLGLECVPVLYEGMIDSAADLKALFDTPSILGGQKIEGVVIKPRGYSLFGLDKKVVMGKFVSEAFKEVHAKEWKLANPASGDILAILCARYHSAARWQKALQHLAEAGALEGSPRDIGALMREVPADIEKECSEEIKEKLFQWAWPHLRRKVVAGLPEWYKQHLLEQQFEQQRPPNEAELHQS